LIIVSVFVAYPLHASHKINIMVYPFENTGDRKHSWISHGMTDAVVAHLSRIQGISVITDGSRRRAEGKIASMQGDTPRQETVIRVAELTGANLVFSGSYVVAGDRVHVVPTLLDAETGVVRKSAEIHGAADGILDLQARAVSALMTDSEQVEAAGAEKIRFGEYDRREITGKPKLSAYERHARGLQAEEIDPEQALVFYEEALEVEPEYLAALHSIGKLLGGTLGRFPEALDYLERANQIYTGRGATNTPGYAGMMSVTGRTYRQKGDLDRALSCFAESRETRDGLTQQDTAGYADLMTDIGNAHSEKGDVAHALAYYSKSQEARERLGLQNTVDYAGLMDSMGAVYLQVGDLDRAMGYYGRSQAVYDSLSLQDTASYAGLMNNTGVVYYRKDHLSRALQYLTRSQAIYDRLGLQHTTDYAGLMTNTGNAHRQKGDVARALAYYSKSQATQERLSLQNTHNYAGLMSSIGRTYLRKGDLDRALEHYRKSRTIHDGLGIQDTACYAGMMNNMGIAYHRAGDLDRALHCLTKSREIHKALGLQNTRHYRSLANNIRTLYREKASNADTLAAAYARDGAYGKAAEIQERAIDLLNEASETDITELLPGFAERLEGYKMGESSNGAGPS